MAQAGQDPALHQQHALLGLGLVPGFTRAGRQDGHLVVLGPLLVAGVDIRGVAAGFADPVAQVIGDNERGDAFDAGHGPGVATQPVRERLGPGGLGKGVIGGDNKELRLSHLPGPGRSGYYAVVSSSGSRPVFTLLNTVSSSPLYRPLTLFLINQGRRQLS